MKRSDPDSADVASRLAGLRRRIAAAAERAGRRAEDVRLVGVSKRQSNERIVAAVAAGLDCLGENFAQEARDKRPALEAAFAQLPGRSPERRIEWRFIGRLQSNKAKLVAGAFDAVDSVDRASLARALDRHAGDAGRRLSICLQVDVSGEAQKAGVAPDALPALLSACDALEHVDVVGLMAIPAATEDPEASRTAFAQLRALRDTLSREPGGQALRELSMGMSNDFEVAVEEGATLVRVGTALFGPRADRPPATTASTTTGGATPEEKRK